MLADVALLVRVATAPLFMVTPSSKSNTTLPVGMTLVALAAGVVSTNLGACVSSASMLTYFRL